MTSYLCLAENMPSGSATRPGDVISHPNGRTTEVTDTDCEGRLVLADGIAHLAAAGVSGIVDIGTLTDAAGYGPSLFAIASTDSKSPSLAIGNPASMTSTPSRASCSAISSFSTTSSEMPGDCSPSRSVVSKMST